MEDNSKGMDNLSKTCHISGILSLMLGLFVVFVGVVNQDYKDLSIGIFMFIVGYAFYKIGSKIKSAL